VARQKKLNEKIVSLVTAAAKGDIAEVVRMLGGAVQDDTS
jgi:hypothetical protein